MYAGLSTVIVYVLKNEYALGEPKLNVKDMYICERNSKSLISRC